MFCWEVKLEVSPKFLVSGTCDVGDQPLQGDGSLDQGVISLPGTNPGGFLGDVSESLGGVTKKSASTGPAFIL